MWRRGVVMQHNVVELHGVTNMRILERVGNSSYGENMIINGISLIPKPCNVSIVFMGL